MQKISLINFEKDIINIKEYIEHIRLVNNVAKDNYQSDDESLKKFIEHLYKFSTEKRLFEYKAIIISLYGVLEKYVNIWIKEHIDTLSDLVLDYQQIPTKLINAHFDLSIKLISLVSQNRFAKYEHLRKEEILKKLNSCIFEPLSYDLNSDAFSPTSGNLKHSLIVESFKPLDINLTLKLKYNDNFFSYLKTKFGENIHSKGDELFQIINDLVIRRNDIAHGTDIDDITSDFEDYIEFLRYYGEAIFETLVQKEIEYESIHSYQRINNIINIFSDGSIKSILAFELSCSRIAIGDFIIIQKENGNFYKKNVLEVQQDNISISAVEVLNTKKLAIRLNTDFNLEQNSQTFYIKKRKS